MIYSGLLQLLIYPNIFGGGFGGGGKEGGGGSGQTTWKQKFLIN